jgi:LTXXQ motif family protein
MDLSEAGRAVRTTSRDHKEEEMQSMRKSLTACGLLIAAAFPALAQPDQQMPMMNNGMMGAGMMGSGPMSNGMMGQGMMSMGPGMMGQGDLKAMVEGRLAYVKTALGITEDQAAAWKAYEDAARANVQSMQTVHQAMMTAMQSGSAIDRMQTHITMMQTGLDALKALQPATEALYKALTPEQQKKADTLLGMGGGMM